MSFLIQIEAEPDDLPIPKDQDLREAILKNLEEDDVWGWCEVTVTVCYDFTIEGHAYLGACSYDSKESFVASDSYRQMVNEAIQDLTKEVEITRKALDRFPDLLSQWKIEGRELIQSTIEG